MTIKIGIIIILWVMALYGLHGIFKDWKENKKKDNAKSNRK
jgi:hypothetical protein